MRNGSAAGFTLIETLVAVALLAGLAAGLARVVVVAQRAVSIGAADSVALVAATQKLEELRSLAWSFDSRTGERVTDTTTDLAQPGSGGGGVGLRPSPAAALESSHPGYVDYLDPSGTRIGTGADPPPGTAYIRRWAVAALGSSQDLLALQVAVIDRRVSSAEPRRAVRPNDPGVLWIATLRARAP